jgi:hypothetical protein
MLKGAKPYNEHVDRFVMYWLGNDIVVDLIRSKRIHFGDLGLLLLLIQQMDPNTGRANITPAALADHIGRDPVQARRMIAVLLRHQLIARWKDPQTGQRCFLIHPYIASVGGPQRRGYLWKQFSEAIDGRHIHPVPGDLELA